MSPEIIEALKQDFLEWSGGFTPESEDQITVYVDYALSTELDAEETRAALLQWMAMENANPSNGGTG